MSRVLTLASQSPRRKQLLEMLGLPIRVVPADIPGGCSAVRIGEGGLLPLGLLFALMVLKRRR